MDVKKITPDQLITDLGGCGRYQMTINTVAHLMKTLVCWSMMGMVILLATPPNWYCDDDLPSTNISMNVVYSTAKHGEMTILDNREINAELMNGSSYNVTTNYNSFKSCKSATGAKCTKFRFEGVSTLVSEFSLVCDAAFTTSLIMSIQSAGSLVGNLVAGQISDLIGRKRPFFGAVLILVVFNFVGILSNHWAFYAACRFLVGVGSSTFMTAKYSLLSEFSLAQHRAWIIGMPSWPLEASIFALVAWGLKEWKYLQIACTVVGLPCFLAWWIMPESFRWYLSHDRKQEADEVLKKVAKYNRKPVIPFEKLDNLNLADGQEEQKDRKYTLLDIFKSRYLIKLTLLLAINWLGMGYISYGVTFGIQSLSGNIYLNFFLFMIVGIPSKGLAIWLENKIGRRWTAMLCFFVTAVGGYLAGIMNYIDTPHRGLLINVFAMIANIGITTTWGPIQTMTIELYPTVIRSIGFGSLSILGRIGAIIGPQVVFLSAVIPGLMYLSSGVISTLCMLALLGLNETKDTNLNDKIVKAKKSTAYQKPV